MTKSLKYVLCSVAMCLLGLSVISLTIQNWLPFGIGLSIIGVLGIMLGPLLALLP